MRYIPGTPPTNAASLAAFLRQEFEKIAQALATPDDYLSLVTLHAAPAKYRDGTIIKADGSDFNPGSGAGVYCYYAGSWHFLG